MHRQRSNSSSLPSGKTSMPATASAITQKGQVTIPKRIRDRLRLRPGDLVLFDDEGPEVRVRKVAARGLFEFCRDHPLRGAGLTRLLRKVRGEWG